MSDSPGADRLQPLSPSFRGVAVVIPCLNEAATIGRVVRDFTAALPGATILVFDNASTDATAEVARAAGALVVPVKRRGKGNVVATILDRVDADFYLMVDGDDTYPASAAPSLLEPLLADRADMVVAQRLAAYEAGSFRPLHVGGNRLVVGLINKIFGASLTDVMSGYRAFTREVALGLPIVAWGFDVETEMTLQLLHRRFVIAEIPVPYGVRPEGSHSKLRTIPDGIRVLLKILGVLKAYKPLTFFGGVALALFGAGAVVGYFPIREYIDTRFVGSVPKAILAAGLMILSVIVASVGVMLHTINFRLREAESLTLRRRSSARIITVHATPP